jgi:hypothetical protein
LLVRSRAGFHQRRSLPVLAHVLCLSNYVDCPTWRAEKERVWAGSHRELIDDAAVEAARSGKPTRELPEGVTFHEEAYEVPYA